MELVDMHASGACGRKVVQVQILSPATKLVVEKSTCELKTTALRMR